MRLLARAAVLALTAAVSAVAVAAPAGAAPTPSPVPPPVPVSAEVPVPVPAPPPVVRPGADAVRTLAATPGQPLRRPAGLAAHATPEAAARAALREYASTLGLADASLRVERTLPATGGQHVVRFGQWVGGVPVLGSGVSVTVAADGRALAVVAKLAEHAGAPGRPAVTAARAVRAARGAGLPAGSPVLALYDPATFGAPVHPGAVPVWRVPVSGADGAAADVLVDARTGGVVLTTDGVRGAEAPQRVCDLGGANVSLDPGTPGYRCPAGDPTVVADPATSAVTDVKQAYDHAAATASFYGTLFGRNSLDGAGGPIVSTARVCATPGDSEPEPCHHSGAFWDGQQMVYAPGYAAARDLVAHELTHGVTQHTANLFYAYQSGAINESMSDVFGELVQRAANPTDLTGPWLLGEDLPTGALRDLGNPQNSAQPSSMTDPLYAAPEYDATGVLIDNGGVHTNSGVGNRAAYLIAQSLGIAKTAHLYYRTLLALPSGANYADLAGTLSATCTSMVGLPLPGLPSGSTETTSAADCAAVGAAIGAVQLTTPPTAPNAAPTEAAECPTGMTRGRTLLSDSFEGTAPSAGTVPADGAAGWTLAGAAPAATGRNAGFSVYAPSTPAGRDESWAHTGRSALIGETADGADATALSATARLTTPVQIPSRTHTYLRFAHVKQLDTDLSTGEHLDGGTVSAVPASGPAVDLGAPAGPGSDRGYDGPVTDGPAAAFSGYSAGYGTSRFDLTQFAGTAIRPQFTIWGGADVSTFWLVDDVEIYTCTQPLPEAARAVTVTATDPGAARVAWAAPLWPGEEGLAGYEVTTTPALAGQPIVVPPNATVADVQGLAPRAAYTFQVTAVSAGAGGGRAPGAAPAATLAPTAVTLRGSATAVAYPATLTLSGTVTRPDTGAVVRSATVTLQGRFRGATAWTTLGTGRTDAAGRYVFGHRPRARYEYRVLAGGAGLAASVSGGAGVSVAPSVAASWRTSAVRRGRTAVFSVSTTPARAYAAVELQRRSGSRWVTVARSHTGSTGRVAFSVRSGSRGAYSYRAVVAAGPDHRTGVSSARSLRVT